MTNINDIKYVQAPEKRPGKHTLIAGIIKNNFHAYNSNNSK